MPLGVALWVVAAWLALTPALGRAASATYVVEYRGDYGYHTDLEQPATNSSVKVDETYTWDMKLATTVSDQGQATSQSTLEASGALRRVSIRGGHENLVRSCTIGGLGPPGAPDLSRLTLSGGALPGSVDAHAFLPASAVPAGHRPPGGDVTVTAASDNVNGDCGSHSGTYALGCQAGSCFDGCLAFQPSPGWDGSFDVGLKGSATPSVSQAGGASQTNSATCATGAETGKRSIRAELIIVNPGAGGGAPLLPPAPSSGPVGQPVPVAVAVAVSGSVAAMPPASAVPAAPPRPAPGSLSKELGRLASEVARTCADAELGTAIDRPPPGGGGLGRTSGISGGELFGDYSLDCARTFAEWRATSVRIAGGPPDRHYTEIRLPRPWPASAGRAAGCPAGARAAACRAVKLALGRYATAAARRASLSEVLSLVAQRAAGARAAFGRDPLAPGGLALQGALARAYSGELVAASRVELRAARTLTRALRAAGLGVIHIAPATQRRAAAWLARAGPPAWLVSRLVAEGQGSASRIRSDFRRLVGRARIAGTADVGTLFRARVASEIPAEAFFASTLADLARLAGAVGDEPGRAALSADVTAARVAADPASRGAALARFMVDAAGHEHGELSLLLQHAAKPLQR